MVELDEILSFLEQMNDLPKDRISQDIAKFTKELNMYLALVKDTQGAIVRMKENLVSAFEVSTEITNSDMAKDSTTDCQKQDFFFQAMREKLTQVQQEFNDFEKNCEKLTSKKLVNQTGQPLPPVAETNQFGCLNLSEPTGLQMIISTLEQITNIDYLTQINLDQDHDDNQLFTEVMASYIWFSRLKDYFQLGYHHIQASHTRRWSEQSKFISNRRRTERRLNDESPTAHFCKNQNVYEHLQKLCLQLPSNYTGIKLAKIHPATQSINLATSNNRVLQIEIFNTRHVFIVLRGFVLESITARGMDEHVFNQNGDIDPFTSSKHIVFRSVTNAATSAIQYYMYAINTGSIDTTLKTMLAWLRSYKNLFTEKCKKCFQLLDSECMVPTWRDTKNLSAYHESCRKSKILHNTLHP